MAFVYPSSDDTYTLLDALTAHRIRDKVVVEIGTGSSTIINSLVENNYCLATDINPHALLNARCDAMLSDLLMNIDQTKVDVLIFNPPYLNEPIVRCRSEMPCDRCLETYSYAGGSGGNDIINRFLRCLTVNEFFLLVTKQNSMVVDGYRTEIVKERKVMGETIRIIHGIRKKRLINDHCTMTTDLSCEPPN